MPTTPNLALPYPILADTSDVPRDIKALADQVDMKVGFAGKRMVSTPETRNVNSYGTLATPDQVTGVVVPADGIVQVRYFAIWQRATADLGSAAIFIDNAQLIIPRLTAAGSNPANGVADNVGGLDQYLTTYPAGLISTGASGDSGIFSTPPTTGYALAFGSNSGSPGGPCEILGLPVGTYTISVRFKTPPAGTLTVKNRSLWVRVLVP